jgi:hypothetical protein
VSPGYHDDAGPALVSENDFEVMIQTKEAFVAPSARNTSTNFRHAATKSAAPPFTPSDVVGS